jgi:23S rRNA pseudouridine1911/1915/1917 synthase
MVDPTISEIETEELQETLVRDVPTHLQGFRLDRAAAEMFPDYSRSRIQLWIDEGALLVNGSNAGRRDSVIAGMQIQLTPVSDTQGEWQAQDIPISLVYEDEHLFVIDKPAGLVVHPGAGNWDNTLLNGMLHLDPNLRQVPRAGIVHRLDKDTSGLMVVARTLAAQTELVRQLQARSVSRIYQAIVTGGPTASGSISEPIGRSPKNRLKMAVVAKGKEAITHYRVLKKFGTHELLELKLETGRTHQIRVHLAYNNWPIVGDPLYSGKSRFPKGVSSGLRSAVESMHRQALHAVRLELRHPATGELMSWQSSLAEDIQDLLCSLEAYG